MKSLAVKSMTFIFALLALSVSSAFASEGTMLHFFEGIEGAWHGNGTFVENPVTPENPVPGRTTCYALDLDVHYNGIKSWGFRDELRFEHGGFRIFNGAFAVRGDNLFIGTGGARPVAVTVLESTPLTLTYRADGTDQFGRWVESTYHLAVTADGHISGMNATELHGRRIADEQFTLTRGH